MHEPVTVTDGHDIAIWQVRLDFTFYPMLADYFGGRYHWPRKG
jgi:hypothetical protein